ncbi:MAG: flavodoxin domain-containing protein, partial [Sphingobium sp.]
VPPTAMDLSHIDYGLLALGNAGYPDFCGFGRKIERWLDRSGARPMFETITMDRQSQEAEAAWQARLRELGAL